jgi:heptosyltransferase-1
MNGDIDPKKICLLHFGQVGDVIMAFSALNAIRKRFPDSEIHLIGGKTPAKLVGDLQLVDQVTAVDRYRLLRGPKIRSIKEILQLVSDVRRERFDLVIDLHSLYETNLLGFLSVAKKRLFASRQNRSIDFLSNFRPRPVSYDPSKHLSEIYHDVIAPLDIKQAKDFALDIDPLLVERIRAHHFQNNTGKLMIGIAVGAGHPSRTWALDKFCELAGRLSKTKNAEIFIFLGPEEEKITDQITEKFLGIAATVSGLSLIELAAACKSLDLFVGNDTGTTHLAAAVGVPVVSITDLRAPSTYFPRGRQTLVVNTDTIIDIAVEDVWQACIDLLARSTEKKSGKKEEPKENQSE